MKKRILNINLHEVRDISMFHEILKDSFGFPDFYGANLDALFDCLRSLRHPEDGLSLVTLESNEILVLEIEGLHSFFSLNRELLGSFLLIIEEINKNEIESGCPPSIHLCLV